MHGCTQSLKSQFLPRTKNQYFVSPTITKQFAENLTTEHIHNIMTQHNTIQANTELTKVNLQT